MEPFTEASHCTLFIQQKVQDLKSIKSPRICTQNMLKLFPQFAKVSIGIRYFKQWSTCVRYWSSLEVLHLYKTYRQLGYITKNICSSDKTLKF